MSFPSTAASLHCVVGAVGARAHACACACVVATGCVPSESLFCFFENDPNSQRAWSPCPWLLFSIFVCQVLPTRWWSRECRRQRTCPPRLASPAVVVVAVGMAGGMGPPAAAAAPQEARLGVSPPRPWPLVPLAPRPPTSWRLLQAQPLIRQRRQQQQQQQRRRRHVAVVAPALGPRGPRTPWCLVGWRGRVEA